MVSGRQGATVKWRMTVRVLLVEDDPSIAAGLAQVLTGQDYAVDWQQSGGAAIAAAEVTDPDIVLLDLGLPDMDGIEVCRILRNAHAGISIIILTARNQEIDTVLGLDAGADDYISKPFRLAELLARLRAQERRREERHTAEVRAGAIEVDRLGRRVTVAGRELSLSPKEFDLLALLVENSGRAVTRERIVDQVWDENWYRSTKTVDMHIVTLRRKLAEAGAAGAHITTLRGVGYRLDAS